MALIVQKYGGSSVGSLDRIQHVVSKIQETRQLGHDLVVVLSAMQGETDRLIQLAHKLAPQPDLREYDALVSTGEQVSTALLAISLIAKNCPARSFTGQQIGIMTDDFHSDARILDVKTELLKQELAYGRVILVAGFQGSNSRGDITTLGRGGSDTTAVALATALQADECQIYTDVDGVYTTDPRLLLEARLLPEISFEEMLEMASLGAKVLQVRSVELASQHNIPLRVLSTFHPGAGTLVTSEDKMIHKRAVSGIAYSREEAIIALSGIPNCAGVEGYILGKISEAHIEIDMITQSMRDKDTIDLTFSLPRKSYMSAWNIVTQLAQELKAAAVSNNPKVVKLSIVGIGMRTQTGVASTMFQALGKAGIPIQMITTSEIKISVVIDEEHLETGVRAVHQAFALDDLPHKVPISMAETGS
ncbi:MAG TPA: aspartate kinase [Gammaproteobacteria bacterium]|nr:aspartate kinase [Gammaproteobacteria bacterium]